jgi:septum site-determining protein MinC
MGDMTDTIVIKGITQGVLVSLNTTPTWDDLITDLCAYIDQRGTFFRGAQWVVDLGKRKVDAANLEDLLMELAARQVAVLAVLSTNEETLAAAQAHELITNLDDVPPPAPRPSSTEIPTQDTEALPEEAQLVLDGEPLPELDSEEYGTAGVLIKRTLRNGRTVRSRGHVVIIGDVNSGAQVIATGDIIIWGKCKGVVHAGAEGDEEAVVCALELAPTQLRIAGLITVPPTKSRRRNMRPEMAQVNNGTIEAVPWT